MKADISLFLAPMAGVTNSIFRRICKERGADVLTTEFVSADGAFTIIDKISQASLSLSSMTDSWPYIYFSFTTQTTLGYGDITPISHLAQVVVISQSIFGQFYIAIVIAYLLRNYIATEAEEFKELTEKPVSAKKSHSWIFSKKP